MDFKITFKATPDYYREAYSEIVKTNWVKRLEPIFAVVMILISIGLWYYDNNGILGFFPILFGALGSFELIKVYTSQKKWLNDRAKSGIAGQDIQLQFTDDLVTHDGPFANGSIKWIGLKSIAQTEKGIIIKPENGTVIYLPKATFKSKDQIDFILSKM